MTLAAAPLNAKLWASSADREGSGTPTAEFVDTGARFDLGQGPGRKRSDRQSGPPPGRRRRHHQRRRRTGRTKTATSTRRPRRQSDSLPPAAAPPLRRMAAIGPHVPGTRKGVPGIQPTGRQVIDHGPRITQARSAAIGTATAPPPCSATSLSTALPMNASTAASRPPGGDSTVTGPAVMHGPLH